MKHRYCLLLGIAGTLLPTAGHADPTVFSEGIALDPGFNSAFAPLNSPYVGAFAGSLNGALVLQSGADLSARGNWDGGITMMADPVDIVLSMSGDALGNTDRGTFSVWGEAEYFGSTTKPFFEIKSPANTAAFDSVNVTVTNGSLSVGGSPVLTAGELNAALSTAVPPTSWTSAYVARGNVSNGAAFASTSAIASAMNSVAIGSSSNATAETALAIGVGANATAMGAFAHGWSATASGPYASAHGYNSTASGIFSTASGAVTSSTATASHAFGLGVKAQAFAETVVGTLNLTDTSPSPTIWAATDAIFRVGNGFGSELSDAITTRKHGQTTLTNKYWKANTSNPLADPSEANDAGGSALVVDGHTTLNGKVTITEAQGDISMGIYE